MINKSPACRTAGLVCLFSLLVSIYPDFWTSITLHAEEAGKAGRSLTQVGQQVPDFSVKTLSGDLFDVKATRGKLLVINFFATWCPPCVAEMPHLEKEIWQVFKSGNFRMISIGREETEQKIRGFAENNHLTFPLAADLKREVYGKFAKQIIPRTYLISPEGKILFQSSGYQTQEFRQLVMIIKRELNGK
jgi:peroxiredoxin